MKLVSVGPVPLLVAFFIFFVPLIGLTACGGSSAAAGPALTYTVSVSPQPASIPVNGTVTFTATTTPSGGKVFW
jgi:multidrug efflux pump subunit AcrA (membrane-fusion protein)